jgi:hypothetical protein
MPRNKAVDIPHQQTTDHRIPRIPQPATAPAPLGRELVSVLTSQADDRDLGLAYAKLAESGDGFATARGLQLLQSAQAKSPNDSALLAGLAYLLKSRGKTMKRFTSLENPWNLTPKIPGPLPTSEFSIKRLEKRIALLRSGRRSFPERLSMRD